MVKLFQDAIPEMEMWAVAAQLEDILLRQYEKTGAESDTFKFYMKVLKIVYLAAEMDARVKKYRQRAEWATAQNNITQELYKEVLVELNKYDTVSDLVSADTLQRYIDAAQSYNNSVTKKLKEKQANG
jgi:hypothetical protein